MTLAELLASRDARQKFQKKLLADHPMLSLVSLTIVMPGSEKRNENALRVADAAVKALASAFGDSMVQCVERDLNTGYEAFMLVDLPVVEVKKLACFVENSHPLGRLFDVDVIGSDGIPVSRQSIGMPPRKCLVCDNDARICMRLRSHPAEELEKKINNLISAYYGRT